MKQWGLARSCTIFAIALKIELQFQMLMEDEVRFGADYYLKRLSDRKGIVENFWTGVRAACIAISLVCTTIRLTTH
jgi:hypothetical protein